MAHAVSKNGHGLVVETSVSSCSPKAEREQGLAMIRRLRRTARPQVVVADKGYHEQDFVQGLGAMGIQAHVPPYRKGRRCRVDPTMYQTEDYVQSQKKRKWTERFFSWLKTTAGLRRTRHRGHKKLDWNIAFAAAAYNLTRIRTLLPAH